MTNENLKETEAKLMVDDLDVIESRLVELGAELRKPRVFERNVRYENTERNLSNQGIVVRLRQDSRVRLTYKDRGTFTDGVIERFEAEVEVDDFDTMDVILNKLGYHAHMTYEKYRTTYIYQNTEIVLDELPYGRFVEIEGHVSDIKTIVESLQLTNAPRIPVSYTGLFDLLIKRLDLSFTDLTFSNFKDVEVDKSILLAVLEG